jgi:hypothetical protein
VGIRAVLRWVRRVALGVSTLLMLAAAVRQVRGTLLLSRWNDGALAHWGERDDARFEFELWIDDRRYWLRLVDYGGPQPERIHRREKSWGEDDGAWILDYWDAGPGRKVPDPNAGAVVFLEARSLIVAAPTWFPIILFGLWPCAAGCRFANAWWTRFERRRRGQCLRCGYRLAGNTSGRCPKCGTDIGGMRPPTKPVAADDGIEGGSIWWRRIRRFGLGASTLLMLGFLVLLLRLRSGETVSEELVSWGDRHSAGFVGVVYFGDGEYEVFAEDLSGLVSTGTFSWEVSGGRGSAWYLRVWDSGPGCTDLTRSDGCGLWATVPDWFPVVLFGLWPGWAIGRMLFRWWRRARRRRRGLCLRCGCNLTGSASGRCPECGAGGGERTAEKCWAQAQ